MITTIAEFRNFAERQYTDATRSVSPIPLTNSGVSLALISRSSRKHHITKEERNKSNRDSWSKRSLPPLTADMDENSAQNLPISDLSPLAQAASEFASYPGSFISPAISSFLYHTFIALFSSVHVPILGF